jgi:hypothetical protein
MGGKRAPNPTRGPRASLCAERTPSRESPRPSTCVRRTWPPSRSVSRPLLLTELWTLQESAQRSKTFRGTDSAQKEPQVGRVRDRLHASAAASVSLLPCPVPRKVTWVANLPPPACLLAVVRLTWPPSRSVSRPLLLTERTPSRESPRPSTCVRRRVSFPTPMSCSAKSLAPRLGVLSAQSDARGPRVGFGALFRVDRGAVPAGSLEEVTLVVRNQS